MIKKAVITAAGKGTRQYPGTQAVQKELFPLVDRDGLSKPTLQIVAEEALNAGIEQIAIVVQAGAERHFRSHFRGLKPAERSSFTDKNWALKQSDLLDRLNRAITYIHQTRQEGYGHAVYCAREWVGDEPFLLLLGDHVYISAASLTCAQQLLKGHEKFSSSVYGIKRTPAELIYLFGTVSGERIPGESAAYRLEQVVEKPEVGYARRHLRVSGLPEDVFLTFFGMHVLTPAIFAILEQQIAVGVRQGGEVQLTTAQAELSQREGAVGLEIDGLRLDMGTPLGYLETQLALALNGVFQHDIDLAYQRFKRITHG